MSKAKRIRNRGRGPSQAAWFYTGLEKHIGKLMDGVIVGEAAPRPLTKRSRSAQVFGRLLETASGVVRDSLLAEWEGLIDQLDDLNVQLTVEEFTPLLAAFRLLVRSGHKFDRAMVVLMAQLELQAMGTDDGWDNRDDADYMLLEDGPTEAEDRPTEADEMQAHCDYTER